MAPSTQVPGCVVAILSWSKEHGLDLLDENLYGSAYVLRVSTIDCLYR